MKDANAENIFQLDGKVPLGKAIPIGLQHILAMFVANITPMMILASVCGLDQTITAKLIQNAMIVAGLGTLIQLCPVWKLGSKLPVVMGISFTFLNSAIFVGTTYGYATIIGCVLIGGIIEGILGLFAKYWIKLISPIVAATVVTAIGFSLLTVGANSFAGGQGAENYGVWQNWVIGSVTLLCCICFQIFTKGYLKVISVLFGLVVGYILSICLGVVDFSALQNTKVVSVPAFLPFKPEFNIGAILSFVVIYLVSATETIGDTTALASSALDRNVTDKELAGSIACDGFVSSIGGLFGCTPITSFSQNVGLVAMTKVVNRFALAIGAIFLIFCGLFPKLAALISIMPQSVLGGAAVMMFASIVVSGIQLITKEALTARNITIVSVALGLGFGLGANTAILSALPTNFQLVFGGSGIVPAAIIAIILNIVIPKEKN